MMSEMRSETAKGDLIPPSGPMPTERYGADEFPAFAILEVSLLVAGVLCLWDGSSAFWFVIKCAALTFGSHYSYRYWLDRKDWFKPVTVKPLALPLKSRAVHFDERRVTFRSLFGKQKVITFSEIEFIEVGYTTKSFSAYAVGLTVDNKRFSLPTGNLKQTVQILKYLSIAAPQAQFSEYAAYYRDGWIPRMKLDELYVPDSGHCGGP